MPDPLSVLCLVAHPDDETILTGGVLAMLAARGAAVHVACATRGEGGELGEPPVCERAQLGEVREAEMVCAVGKLKGKSLTFLGYVDPAVGPASRDDPTGRLYPFEADLTVFAGQIAASVKQHGAQVVLTHGSNGEYGHPAHLLVHTAARIAVESFAVEGGAAPGLYSFAAMYADHPYPRLADADDPAHFVVDVTPWLDAKEAAALCHTTQTSLFIRRRSEAAGRPLTVREVLLTREGLRRHWPPAGPLDDPLARFLQMATGNR